MTWEVYVNEQPLSALGIWVESLTQRFEAPSRAFGQIAIPGRHGVVLAAEPDMPARLLRVTGSIDPAARTITARLEAENRLKALSYAGLVKVTADDDETAPVQIDAVCEGVSIDPVAHPMVTQVSRFAASFRCPDPTWYDVVGLLISANATPSAVPCGTAPAGGIVRVMAPAWSANVVDPVVRYRNAASVVIAEMAFSITLVSGLDYLELDLDRSTVAKYASGVRSNAIANLASGDFWSFDPMDGDVFSGIYGTVEVVATSGSPSLVWSGVRRWL